MKKYNKKFKYAFFLMKNKKTNKIRISSFHNAEGTAQPASKLWIPISDRLEYKEVESRAEYLRIKKDLEDKYCKHSTDC